MMKLDQRIKKQLPEKASEEKRERRQEGRVSKYNAAVSCRITRSPADKQTTTLVSLQVPLYLPLKTKNATEYKGINTNEYLKRKHKITQFSP